MGSDKNWPMRMLKRAAADFLFPDKYDKLSERSGGISNYD